MSKIGKLNKTDWKKLGIGAAVAAVGAILAYITEVIPTVDLGETWTPVVTAGWAIIANMVRKLLTTSE